MCHRARRPAPITLATPCPSLFDESAGVPCDEKLAQSKFAPSSRSALSLKACGAGSSMKRGASSMVFQPVDRLSSYGSSSSEDSGDNSEPGSPPMDTAFTLALCTADTLRSYSRAVQEIVRHRRFGTPALAAPALLMEHLYLGDASAAMDTDTLRAMGISAIVNCASGAVLTNREYYDDSFEYLEFEAEDHPDYELLNTHFGDTKAFLDACLQSNTSALVHCAAGINRSATLAVAYYMVTARIDILSAVSHCFAQRPIILCNESFINQLVMFAYCNGLLRPL